jgi:hypothetical protein
MRRLSKSEGAFILNMTLFLVGMNLGAGLINETGTFEVRRVDMTQAECTDAGGSWTGMLGGGYCTLSATLDIQYEDKFGQIIQQQICVNPEVNMSVFDCAPRTYQDEGVANSIIDTTLKTLGDISSGLASTAKLFSATITSPFGFLSNIMLLQCANDRADDPLMHCTDSDMNRNDSWNRILNYLRIPVYMMYGLFFAQIIMNKSFGGVT